MKIESSIGFFMEQQKQKQAREDLNLCLITIPKHREFKKQISDFLKESFK